MAVLASEAPSDGNMFLKQLGIPVFQNFGESTSNAI